MNVDGEWDTTAAYNVGLASAALKGLNVIVFARTWIGLYYSSTSADSKAGADISKFERQAMRKVLVLMLRNIGTGLLYFASAICNTDYREAIWWTAVMCEPILVILLTLLLTEDKSMLTPPMEHFIERIEAFLIIALGFTILSLVEEPADFSNTGQLIVNIGMGFMIVFNVKLLHFDVEVVDSKDHALRRGPKYTLVFMTLTGIVAAGLSMMGSGAGSVVALASSCISTSSTEDLTLASIGEVGDNRRIDFWDEALVHRRNEDSDLAKSVVELDNSSDVEEDLEEEESSACDISDSNKSQQLFVYGFAIVMVGEALYRLIHKADYEDFKGAVLLYWTQFVCMLVSGPLMIFLYEGLDIAAITLLSWGFGLSLFLVILNLLDEIIDVIKFNRAEKKRKKQLKENEQEKGLITDDGSKQDKYVIEDDKEKGLITDDGSK